MAFELSLEHVDDGLQILLQRHKVTELHPVATATAPKSNRIIAQEVVFPAQIRNVGIRNILPHSDNKRETDSKLCNSITAITLPRPVPLSQSTASSHEFC